MTELTQSLASAPTETKVSAKVDVIDPPSFPELIYAHYDWWRELRGDGLAIAIVSVCRVKPFPREALLAELGRARAVAVVEEHNVRTGFAGMLALEMVQAGLGRRMFVRGIEDCVTEVVGSREFLMRHHGLDRSALARDLRGYMNAH